MGKVIGWMGQGVARHLRFRPAPSPTIGFGRREPLPFLPPGPLGRGILPQAGHFTPFHPNRVAFFTPAGYAGSRAFGKEPMPMSHPLSARRRLALLAAVWLPWPWRRGLPGGAPPSPSRAAPTPSPAPGPSRSKPRGTAAPSGWKEPRWGASTATPPSPLGDPDPGPLDRPPSPPAPWPPRTSSLLRLPAGVQRPGPTGDLAGGRGPDPHPLLLPRRGVL